MKAGRNLQARLTRSSDGATVEDATFTLEGFTKAIREVENSCKLQSDDTIFVNKCMKGKSGQEEIDKCISKMPSNRK